MKNHLLATPNYVPLRDGQFLKFIKYIGKITNCYSEVCSFRRQRQILLGIIIVVILSWAIGSVYLINTRRSERSAEDVLARKATVATLLSGRVVANR